MRVLLTIAVLLFMATEAPAQRRLAGSGCSQGSCGSTQAVGLSFGAFTARQTGGYTSPDGLAVTAGACSSTATAAACQPADSSGSSRRFRVLGRLFGRR